MKDIVKLIDIIKLEIKEKLPKIYSKELVDVLFHEFYTKISYVDWTDNDLSDDDIE